MLYAIANTIPVNVAAFAANHLGKVGRAAAAGISVGGMITQIARYFGYDLAALNEAPIAGMTKLDMSALVNQGMIQIQGKHFGVISQKRVILTLPDPDKISILERDNWWYV